MRGRSDSRRAGGQRVVVRPSGEATGRDTRRVTRVHAPSSPPTSSPALRCRNRETNAVRSRLYPDRARARTPSLQDAVLLDQVLDDLRLVAVDPAGEGREEEAEWGDAGHRGGESLLRSALT